jgi:hypothetical protein
MDVGAQKMENFRMNLFKASVYSILWIIFLVSCSTGILKYNKEKDIFKNAEFEKKVLIKEVPVEVPEKTETLAAPIVEPKPVESLFRASKKAVPQAKAKKKSSKKKKNDEPAPVLKRQPELENSEGFDSDRRPLVDPFRVGEKVIHTVSYFGTSAGVLTFSVGPFVEVNGRKSYNFITEIKSSRLFSSFYSVQDKVETYMDYVDLVPHVFKLDIKESGQLKEAQSFFDHEKLKVNYWENKYTEKNGHEDKKLEWDILEYSQNAFSSIFYMRIFKWTPGKDYAFRVSDDGKNVLFKATAIEKTVLNTDAGQFKAIKVKAEVVSRGALAQTGDLFFWMSDDEHKYILRIEAKIKIGTLVSEVTKIIPGR